MKKTNQELSFNTTIKKELLNTILKSTNQENKQQESL